MKRVALMLLLGIGIFVSGSVQGFAVLVALLSAGTPDPPAPAPTVTATETKTLEPTPTETEAARDQVIVVRVADGDTIRVQNLKGREFAVRIVGIDTPETVDPRKPDQCYGDKASDTAKELLSGKRVTLVPDSKTDTLDKYGRTLAYVEHPESGDFGLFMIRSGFAREYTYDRAYDRQGAYKAAEKKAKAEGKGLWGECVTPEPTEKPTAKPKVKPKPKPTQEPAEKPDSTYYANCTAARAAGAAPIRRGQPGYSRRLDRDGDGVACE